MHHLIERLVDLATRLGHWGYLLIFGVVLLECQALLGLFIPGESLVLISGFLAGQGVFDLDVLIIAVAGGAIVGDTIGYELGRHFGLEWLRRHGKWVGIRDRHVDKVGHFIARHGGKSVSLSHFLHVLRALMPYFAGAHRMPYRRFFLFNAVGCVVWASVFTLLGYFLGESWSLVEKWVGRAGAIGGVLLVVFIALARCWSWLVAHEAELRAQWQTVMERPRVVAFRRRFARQIEFVEDRLTPGGYLGLHLTIGAVIVLLAGGWFGGIVEDLLAQDPIVALDQQIALWFEHHATPTLTHLARVVTFTASPQFLVPLSVIVAVVLLWRKSWHRVVTLLLAVGGGNLLNLGIKQLFHRTRPVFEHPFIVAHTYSFPSGHTVGATLFYGLMAVFFMAIASRWRWRVLAPLAAIFLIFLVALSRLYLGAHYLSDVLGAMGLGVMWLTICVTAVEINRRYRLHHRSGS